MNQKAFVLGVLALLLAACRVAHAVSFSGQVTLADGSPAEATSVWLFFDQKVYTTTADTEGAFSFISLTPGSYGLVARKEGYALGLWRGIISTDATTELCLGQAATITLHTYGPKAEPAAGAYLKSMVVNGSAEVPLDRLYPLGYPLVRSDDTGLLAVSELPENSSVEMVVGHRDFASFHVPGLPAGVKFAVNLSPGIRLSGRVTGNGGEGLSAARVVLFAKVDGNATRVDEELTDPDGFYVIQAPALERSFLTAIAPGYPAIPPVGVALTAGKAVRADITLQRAGDAKGRVADAAGEAMAGVWAYYRQGPQILSRAVSGPDGEFSLPLAPGGGAVGIDAPAGRFVVGNGEREIPESAKEDAPDLEFVLRPLPTIKGTAVDTTGSVVPDVLVRCLDPFGTTCCLTDQAGRFQLPLVHAPANRRVPVYAEDGSSFRRAQASFDLDQPADVRLELVRFEPNVGPDPQPLPDDAQQLLANPAPDLKPETWLNADAKSLDSLKGKVVVLTFLTTSEQGRLNRDRLTLLNAVNTLFSDKETVAVVGVHEGGADPNAVRSALADAGVTFPVALDTALGDTFRTYAIFSVPQTILIDKAGKVRYYCDADHLLERIKALLREP